MRVLQGAPLVAILFVTATAAASVRAAPRGPNVLLILTDDQGHGDLGIHGNPVIQTPNLDRLARQSTRLTRFHSAPVCSPTRASLLTGRYNYRTRVVDTFIGRSMMDPAEVTLAEMLGRAGYRTGIFGKWHLGDCYPMRPIDQGFQEALVLRGGGIGQPSDPPGGTSYFDPVLQHNGEAEKRAGFCSDVYTDAAIEFIARGRDRAEPFFVYLPFNCPHTPVEVPESYRARYAGVDFDARLPRVGHPLSGPINAAVTAGVYAMITNIDDNVGRLLGKLDELGLARDTIVIFMTDNGPQQPRYTSGMRGGKGWVYDGGIRVPCFVRWPGKLPADREFDTIAAHIDIVPTLLDACAVDRPGEVRLDGLSLWPLLTGKVAPADWPARTLFFQWHRGDAPEKYRAFAAREPRFKLVQASGVNAPAPARFELFDMAADPYEMHDVAAQHPDVVARLKDRYSKWFDDVSQTRGFDPPRIHLASGHESPTALTRQDWRGSRAVWGRDAAGSWEVEVERPALADLVLTLRPARGAGTAHVRIGGVERHQPIEPGAERSVFESVALPKGAGRLEAWVEAEGDTFGVWSVDVRVRD